MKTTHDLPEKKKQNLVAKLANYDENSVTNLNSFFLPLLTTMGTTKSGKCYDTLSKEPDQR